MKLSKIFIFAVIITAFIAVGCSPIESPTSAHPGITSEGSSVRVIVNVPEGYNGYDCGIVLASSYDAAYYGMAPVGKIKSASPGAAVMEIVSVSGNKAEYVFNNVPEGNYYALAMVKYNIGGGMYEAAYAYSNTAPMTGDCVGVFGGSIGNYPSQPNIRLTRLSNNDIEINAQQITSEHTLKIKINGFEPESNPDGDIYLYNKEGIPVAYYEFYAGLSGVKAMPIPENPIEEVDTELFILPGNFNILVYMHQHPEKYNYDCSDFYGSYGHEVVSISNPYNYFSIMKPSTLINSQLQSIEVKMKFAGVDNSN